MAPRSRQCTERRACRNWGGGRAPIQQYKGAQLAGKGIKTSSAVQFRETDNGRWRRSMSAHRHLGALAFGRQIGAVDGGDAIGAKAAVALRRLARGGAAVEGLDLLREARDEVL